MSGEGADKGLLIMAGGSGMAGLPGIAGIIGAGGANCAQHCARAVGAVRIPNATTTIRHGFIAPRECYEVTIVSFGVDCLQAYPWTVKGVYTMYRPLAARGAPAFAAGPMSNPFQLDGAMVRVVMRDGRSSRRASRGSSRPTCVRFWTLVMRGTPSGRSTPTIRVS